MPLLPRCSSHLAAEHIARLEHDGLVARVDEVLGGREARQAGADDGDSLGLRWSRRIPDKIGQVARLAVRAGLGEVGPREIARNDGKAQRPPQNAPPARTDACFRHAFPVNVTPERAHRRRHRARGGDVAVRGGEPALRERTRGHTPYTLCKLISAELKSWCAGSCTLWNARPAILQRTRAHDREVAWVPCGLEGIVRSASLLITPLSILAGIGVVDSEPSYVASLRARR